MSYALLFVVTLFGCRYPGPTASDGTEFRLSLPVSEPERFDQVVGVDHDPAVHDDLLGRAMCSDYLGRTFPWCYDEHHGTDFILTGGFPAMDSGSTPIIAAADGVVVDREDGNYDHCHALLTGEIDCDGYPQRANFVVLEHDSGFRTLYWHMMLDSVAVEVGASVQTGDLLGLVGSSGNSSMPHLHFALETLDGQWIDPYAGPFSQEMSYWCDQGPPEGLPETCSDEDSFL